MGLIVFEILFVLIFIVLSLSFIIRKDRHGFALSFISIFFIDFAMPPSAKNPARAGACCGVLFASPKRLKKTLLIEKAKHRYREKLT